jgi:formamidopyrimidine-DNA glycosylase
LRVWKNQPILTVESTGPSYFFVTPPATLRKNLQGQNLVTLIRHGKTLLAGFEGGGSLLFHLGMTGQFVTQHLKQDGHVHLILHLKNGRILSFRDVRKFGKVEWLPRGKSRGRLDHLGPDALTITDQELSEALSSRRVAVKTALLNQALVAGIGNIYADEALFRAKILPTRSAARLTQVECSRLALEVRRLLAQAIKMGGSTINDYVQGNGKKGGFQQHHQVYGRTSLPCLSCRAPIARVVLGGRSTHFCPSCQA